MLALALGGCAGEQAQPVEVAPATVAPAPADTPRPAPEPLPGGEDYATETVELFFPEDADEASARYRLSYSAPVFNNHLMDEAVDRYLDELYTRVTEERLPLADRAEGEALPCTEVAFAVQYAQLPQGGYTNIIFTETASYGGDSPEERSVYTIVSDPDGRECSLAAVSGEYQNPYGVAAQQVWNIIDREPGAYYGDLDVESIAGALDLYNGFTVADEGFTVFIPAGAIAPEEQGMLEFSFAHSAMYPGFVGDVITAADYEAMLPQLNAAAAACGPDFSSFAAPPTGGQAMAFMRAYLLRGRAAASLSAAEFSAAYEGIFGAAIPPEAGPGVELSGDAVTLTAPAALYRFQCMDAYPAEGGCTITGSVILTTAGSADFSIPASASASFVNGANGWVITGFEVM